MTYRIILDPTLSEGDLRKIWGLDHGQRLGLDADPTNWTGVWVDARGNWVGNLPAKVLVGDINGRSGSKFAGCKMATIGFVLGYNVAKQKEIHL